MSDEQKQPLEEKIKGEEMDGKSREKSKELGKDNEKKKSMKKDQENIF